MAEPALGETVHKQAAALRTKYYVGKYRVRPGFVGFHPANRGGQAPNGERCVTLLKNIIRDGYDAAEGDHFALLVQEMPGENMCSRSTTTPCTGTPCSPSSIEGVAAQYGSLSPSHLNQSSKNILGKLPLGIDADCQ